MKHTKELIRQVCMNQPRVTLEEAYQQVEGHMRAARVQRGSSDAIFLLRSRKATPVSDRESGVVSGS
jgi:hypothetical protein